MVAPLGFSEDSHAGVQGTRIYQLDAKGGGEWKTEAFVTTPEADSPIEPAPADAQGKPGDDEFIKP